MKTTYMTVTVHVNHEVPMDKTRKARKKPSFLPLIIFGTIFCLVCTYFAGMGHGKMIVAAERATEAPLTVHEELKNATPDNVAELLSQHSIKDILHDVYEQRDNADQQGMFQLSVCYPKITVEESTEETMETVSAAEVEETIVTEVEPIPTIKPLENRGSYALRYFEGYDCGTTEHVNGLGEFQLTFYCTCKKCCGKDPSDPAYGITRSGTRVQEGRTIAVDPKIIALGQEVYIEGFGTFTAEDTGSGIGNKRIDVYVSDHQVALNCGVAVANVYA